jgi:NAD(P)-dependent dehydrogenase (short-subunit alcohol dehydrogenase family)
MIGATMSYPKTLESKVALVVGGSGGIGAAASRLLAQAGAQVTVTYRPDGRGESIAADLVRALPEPEHLAVAADVSHTPSLRALRDAVTQKFGGLHILVNAAGFTKPVPHADLNALDDDLIDRMFQVNWRGQFATIRTFVPLLKASGDGLIVSISSIAAFTGVGSSIAYCAAKAGIEVMTKSLARVLAPEIRVLAVSPGVVDTAFVTGRGADFNEKVAAAAPLKRIGRPEEIAAAILACATHLTFSTGTTIVVDGGRAL